MPRRLILAVMLSAAALLAPYLLKPTPAFAVEFSECGDIHRSCIRDCSGVTSCIEICGEEYRECKADMDN